MKTFLRWIDLETHEILRSVIETLSRWRLLRYIFWLDYEWLSKKTVEGWFWRLVSRILYVCFFRLGILASVKLVSWDNVINICGYFFWSWISILSKNAKCWKHHTRKYNNRGDASKVLEWRHWSHGSRCSVVIQTMLTLKIHKKIRVFIKCKKKGKKKCGIFPSCIQRFH